MLYSESWGVYAQACVHFMQNNQEKAVKIFAWLVENKYFMHIRVAVDSTYALALLYQMKRQPEKAAEMTSQLVKFAQDTNDPGDMLIASSCQARLSLLQGDISSAVRWLRTANTTLDAGIMLWWIEVPRITECRVLVAE